MCTVVYWARIYIFIYINKNQLKGHTGKRQREKKVGKKKETGHIMSWKVLNVRVWKKYSTQKKIVCLN